MLGTVKNVLEQGCCAVSVHDGGEPFTAASGQFGDRAVWQHRG